MIFIWRYYFSSWRVLWKHGRGKLKLAKVLGYLFAQGLKDEARCTDDFEARELLIDLLNDYDKL